MDMNGVLGSVFDAQANALRVVGFPEAYSIGSNAQFSTAAMSVTSGYPRFIFPDAATTTAYMTMGFPPYWSSVTIGFDWTNDHSATGNVRWSFTFRGNDMGGVITTSEINQTVAVTQPAAAANGGHRTDIMWTDLPIVHGAFGTLWALEMSRLGGDAADTLAGPVGFMEAVFLRGSV